MAKPHNSNSHPTRAQTSRHSKEKYSYLKAEAKAPYRLLRRFIYVVFGASGFIGAFIFLMQVMTLRNLETTLPNFALQVGVLALMLWLLKIDRHQ